MAKRKIFYQPQLPDFSHELDPELLKIVSSGPDNPSFKPDLEDNQKRWLIVGICLQSIITPALRTYIEPYILRQYNSLKQSKRIDKQTFNTYFPGTSSYSFNYEAINNNATLPRIRGREQRFNYNVTNHVDFSKLFLATNMTQYTAFDATIDLSALLGQVIYMDVFQKPLKVLADQLRSDVRNTWAHCNFDEWHCLQYQSSFQKMYSFIKNLNLSQKDEKELLTELTKWEKSGFQFLQGYAIGEEIAQEIRRQIKLLLTYSLKMKSETEETFSRVQSALIQIDEEITTACDRMGEIEKRHDQHEESICALNEGVDKIRGKLIKVQHLQMSNEEKISANSSDLKDMSKNVDKFRNQQLLTEQRVSSLENKTQLSDDTSMSIQTDKKIFFYPPDRTECFVARERELLLLKERFVLNKNLHYTQVICGLGGCGKTTLSIEFSWRFQEMYPSGVFWMSAESSETLEDSVSTLAIDVNVVGNNSKETFKNTLKWLSNLTGNWLLIIDNADEETFSWQITELFFGAWKRASKGHIMITTRREQKHVENSMRIKHEDIVCLYTLDYDEGATFLKKRTGFQITEEDNADIETIVNELGGLPLALEQAAAHIKSINCTFSEYIRRFQKKRLKILKALPEQRPMSKERLTIKTTWQLNIDYICEESKNEELGTAAKTVMDITSFLFADDIPTCLINIGNPQVNDEDLVDALEEDNTMGLKQIIEILTRFSLFQSFRSETLSVHRLVQEVIRDSMDDSSSVIILKKATRMINHALHCTETPYDILHINTNKPHTARGALILWSKIAVNANILKEHLVRLAKRVQSEQNLCFNEETITILKTTAIFHSLHQRQGQALADQEQMSLIIPTLDLPEDEYRKVTAVTIPLQHKDRKRIQDCLASVIHDENKTVCAELAVPLDSETLRLKGNEAFMSKKYDDALQYYTEAIRACPENNIDSKILANRSQLYIHISQYQNALNDANKCIKIARDNHNAYVMKAYAIAELIKCGHLSPTWKGVGLASASKAAYINKDCLLKKRMKMSYPVIDYILLDHDDLQRELMTDSVKPFTTVILRKGRYNLKNVFFTPKNFQVIGAEDGVEIKTGQIFQIQCPCLDEFVVGIKTEAEIHVHFENIFFVPEGNQVIVGSRSIATFYDCKFSNGQKGCDKFPKCKGENGCISPLECISQCQENMKYPMGSHPTGQRGYAGICAKGGKIYMHSCFLDRCGGGGVLSVGDGALIDINYCVIQNMRQTGIEAREGGTIRADNNVIIGNQAHGVAIGPRGLGYLTCNTIQGNGQEGIWSGGIIKEESAENYMTVIMKSEGGSKAIIIDNIIYQNGLSGISFDGGHFTVKGNKIFENWLWGMQIKSRSSCYALNNNIFENKCGGMNVEVNYSASVLIDGNTIQNHPGPGLRAKAIKFQRKYPGLISEEETISYTRPVIKTTTNIFRNNNMDVQHPKTFLTFLQACCYCHEMSSTLKTCGQCKKATYCSKECQTSHWKRHKHTCKLLQESFIIEINMTETKPNGESDIYTGYIRSFNPKSKGIQKGPPPDKFSSKKFIVKIQTGKEYSFYDPETEMTLYDKSVTLDIWFSNSVIYHLATECGVLTESEFTTKKIYCWASFKNRGNTLCIYTDNLPPLQTW